MKNFKDWHIKKEGIDLYKNIHVYFHAREVWWCSLGLNIGSEQDGKGRNFSRPILVFKKFNKEIFWAIPLSTKIKSGRFYFPINISDDIERVAVLSQLRLIDVKRLITKIGMIFNENYTEIEKAVIKLCSS